MKRCAKWCGRGCTEQEYQQAVSGGTALARRLGKGWKSVVWENLGWHYQAVSPCRRLKVHPNGTGYTAFLGEASSPGGTWAEHGRTPESAIRAVVRVAKREVVSIAELVEGL